MIMDLLANRVVIAAFLFFVAARIGPRFPLFAQPQISFGCSDGAVIVHDF
jgi:hypothetical protein